MPNELMNLRNLTHPCVFYGYLKKLLVPIFIIFTKFEIFFMSVLITINIDYNYDISVSSNTTFIVAHHDFC
jgi:hypothetical protein